MKRFFWIALIVLSLIGIAVQAQESITIGNWWGPGKDQKGQQAFNDLAAAGFNTTMVGTWQSSNVEILKVLDYCKNAGVKVILTVDGDEYGIPGYMERIESWVKAFKDHPALYAYMIGDEPWGDRLKTLGEVADRIRKIDNKHVIYDNLLPAFAWEPYEQNTETYIKAVKPGLLSYDCYVLFPGSEDKARYFDNLGRIRTLSLKHKIPFNNIFLSIPHGGYRDPSEADMRWQAFTSLAYGAKGITYFTYITPPPTNTNYAGWGEGIIRWDGSPTSKYPMVKRINADVRRLSPILAPLKSTGIYQCPAIPNVSEPLPEKGPIVRVEGGEFVIGYFESSVGQMYAMIVNRDMRKSVDAKLVFNQKHLIGCAAPSTGRMKNLPLMREGNSWTCNISLAAGDGRLIGIGNLVTKLNEGSRANVWGTVSYLNSDGSYLCVDDGSGKFDSYGHSGIGVSLRNANAILVGEYVSVSGFVKCRRYNGRQFAILEPTQPEDIVLN